MSVVSSLRPSLSRGIKAAFGLCVQTTKQQIKTPKNLQYVIIRQMGGGGHGPPTMIKVPSRWPWNFMKDELHFFFMIGAIPVFSVIIYSNIFVGQAELRDIPEGYQPHCWEYEKHPISRFLARYIIKPYEKKYEQNLHFQAAEGEKALMRKRSDKIHLMMQQRQDYKAWYYKPVDKGAFDEAITQLDMAYDADGKQKAG